MDAYDVRLFKWWIAIPVIPGLLFPLIASYYFPQKEEKMAEVTSISQLMKQNARLRKHAETAKKAVIQRDYAGPPGEIVCRFKGPSVIIKDGKTYYILDFRVDGEVNGQQDHSNARVGILHSLNDSEYSTEADNLARMFADLQLMGIDTPNMTMEQIDKALAGLKDQQFKIRVVPSKKDKTRMYFNIVGHVDTDADYSSEADDGSDGSEDFDEDFESTTADEFNEADDTSAEDEEVDEWQDELAEEPADEPADEELRHEDFNPSDWVNYEVDYKPARSPKPLTFKVVSANNTDGTVVLIRDGKKTKARYLDLILK